MSQTLKEILELHRLWLCGDPRGKRANLYGVDPQDANLEGTNLRRSNLEGTNLRRSNLKDANLEGTNLRWAKLRWANLYDANLKDANLSWADFRCAELQRVNLQGAILRGTILKGADLKEATGIQPFGPVGAHKRMCYAVRHDDCVMMQAGCFWGSLDEIQSAIRRKYGENSHYEQLAVDAANQLLSE